MYYGNTILGQLVILGAAISTVMGSLTPDVFSQITTTLGTLVVLAWYMYYNQTKTMPELQAKHTELVKEILKDNREATESIANKFTQSLAEERINRKEELDSLKSWMEDNVCKVPCHPENTEQ